MEQYFDYYWWYIAIMAIILVSLFAFAGVVKYISKMKDEKYFKMWEEEIKKGEK